MYILTFDIEDWFHINDSTWYPETKWLDLEKRVVPNTKIILAFLKQHQIKATFFVLGWIAEHYPDLVKKIAADGYDIGYHSYSHRIPRFQSKAEFELDLLKGISLLEELTNKKVEYYRAPNFSLQNKWQIDCLIANGITLSSSIKYPLYHKGKKLPAGPFIFSRGSKSIIEMPLLSKNFLLFRFAYSGSGYFRLLPSALIKQLFKNKDYVMMYFHPRDFDFSQPTHPVLGLMRNWMNTINTTTALAKLEMIAATHNIVSIGDAMKSLCINNLETIDF
jgi:peptidoglycan-N-acetylglucosamine deacetylase